MALGLFYVLTCYKYSKEAVSVDHNNEGGHYGAAAVASGGCCSHAADENGLMPHALQDS